MPSHLLASFIGMMPAMLAEQTVAMADAMALMSEYTDKEDRAKLSARLTALLRGKRPARAGRGGDEFNPDNFPGRHLHGAQQVRQWLGMFGTFRKGQIQD